MALSTMHRYPTVVSHTGLTTDCSTIDCSTQTEWCWQVGAGSSGPAWQITVWQPKAQLHVP